MAKIKAEIIAKGTVQKVGYRDHVQETARKLNIKGYVENLKDGTVKIICETDKENLQNFIKLINIKKDLINVENIEIVKTQPATGEYKYFEIKYGPLEEEMGERMVAAFKIASATRQDIKNMHTDLKDSIVSMHSDLKESIVSMHTDLKDGIQSMHQDMNQNFKEMAIRYDAISAELLRTREELKRAVDNLVRVIEKFLEKT
jgi:acylphosphatase